MSKKDRKYTRIILPKDKRAETKILLVPSKDVLASGEPEKEFEATVMNFSEGGLGFSMLRKGFWTLRSMDNLVILSVVGLPPFDEMAGISLEVKWVLDNSELAHIGFGCQFQNISDALRDKLRSYIATF